MAGHWSHNIGDRLIDEHPEETIVCASGVSPSGIVHAGNLRELLTTDAVYRRLLERNHDAKFIFYWDDFDRFRKPPEYIPKEYAKFVGMPYCAIPSPDGEGSYADFFISRFEEVSSILGVSVEFVRQSEMYSSGAYDDLIIQALENKHLIAEIISRNLTENMSNDEKRNYYPLSVYSRFTNKDDTQIISFNGSKIKYRCNQTGKIDSIDLCVDHVAKLSWKVDWAMRWAHSGIHFEPGGHDHSVAGGSYDVSSQLATEVFGISPPLFQKYAFVNKKGSTKKMSGSLGNLFSPEEMLEIYSPEMVRWFFLRNAPENEIGVAFDQDVIRVYDEFDNAVQEYVSGNSQDIKSDIIRLSMISTNCLRSIEFSFRKIAGLGDAVDFNITKLLTLLDLDDDSSNVGEVIGRAKRAQVWLEKYNPESRSKLLPCPNLGYYSSMDLESKENIFLLKTLIEVSGDLSPDELSDKLFDIPIREGFSNKEKKRRQKKFFTDVYNILFGKNSGPKLNTFVWAKSDKSDLVKLLEYT